MSPNLVSAPVKLTKKGIAKHFAAAERIALGLIEERARKILREHPKLKEFVMAMGTASFTFHDEAYSDERGSFDYIEPEDYNSPAYMKPVGDILREWDGYLKLTGTPMRFTAHGEKITDW